MSYRLLAGTEDDIDRILLKSAREWGIATASRYNRLKLASFEAIGADPILPGSKDVAKSPVFGSIRSVMRAGSWNRISVLVTRVISSFIALPRMELLRSSALRMTGCCWLAQRGGCFVIRGADTQARSCNAK